VLQSDWLRPCISTNGTPSPTKKNVALRAQLTARCFNFLGSCTAAVELRRAYIPLIVFRLHAVLFETHAHIEGCA